MGGVGVVGGVGRDGWWWVVVVVVSKASLTPPCEECETLETVKHHFSLPIQQLAWPGMSCGFG